MDTNVKGVFFLTEKLLPLLRAAATAEDPARVINVGSIDGIKTPGFDDGPSKAAVHHLTRRSPRIWFASTSSSTPSRRSRSRPGCSPAGLDSGGKVEGQDWVDRIGAGNPRDRVGTMEDIAGLANSLSSRAGAYTVGETITCDGGSVGVVMMPPSPWAWGSGRATGYFSLTSVPPARSIALCSNACWKPGS